MSCSCVRCPACGGKGVVWFSPDGKYLGAHGYDEMFDTSEICDECRGTGIDEICDECMGCDEEATCAD